jgi:anti-anti-sigma factor
MTVLPEAEAPVIEVAEPSDAVTALDLQGEFDIAAVPELLMHARRALAGDKHLIVNLSGATFIDSSMLHALFDIDAAARNAGRAFVLQFGTHAAVERVFEITEAHNVLRTAPTRDAALELIEREADGED